MTTTSGHKAVRISDNHTMTGSADSPLRRVLRAPFTRRAWAELCYTFVTFPLAVGGFIVAASTVVNGPLWAVSAPWLRKLGAANRALAAALLDEHIPAPAPLRRQPVVRVRTPDSQRLAGLAEAEGAQRAVWGESSNWVRIVGLPASQVAELAAAEHVPVQALRPAGYSAWIGQAGLDLVAWRTRGYIALKLPLAVALLVAAASWLGALTGLTAPLWWALAGTGLPLASSFVFMPAGAALLLAAPWLTHAAADADRMLARALLGPVNELAERVRDLEKTRARAVDDSAARLRNIERDLHDGAQAQLVALAMKLGLAKDKLEDSTPPDLTRVAQLVDDAHRSAIEAIAELRTLARGIHPSVLDNGLTDALSTLAARSAVPVELIADIPERPSDAIETIAYFSAAELLANVAKHSGAGHATLEAVHVPGLLRIRVTDDGNGGAAPVPDGGLNGLADRVRTVDGRLDIDSPPGGPTVVTVELPSHA